MIGTVLPSHNTSGGIAMQRSSVLLATFISTLLFGCSEQKFHSIEDSEDAGEPPSIQVDPTFIDYGVLDTVDEQIRSFVISSIGGIDLELSTVAFSTDPGGFTILTTELDGAVLEPESSITVDVAFSPVTEDGVSAQIVVGSNDERNEAVGVELVVSVDIPGPQLLINPDPLDMGNTYVGCERTNEAELTNVGDETLEIYEIGHDGDSLSIVSAPETPFSLEPDETAMVYFQFVPAEVSEVSTLLTVTSNEPIAIREASQTGQGSYGAEYEDEWDVPDDPPSDIVFFVDQSCSMDDDVARLATNFSTFISELTTYSNDWQIIVANQDTGCNSTGGVLSPDLLESAYISSFQEGVAHGSDGAWGFFYTEAGLTVTSEAIQMTDPGECNHGFLRPEAMLHIIMVSDEPEQSPMNWDFYVDKVVAKKGSVANVKFSAVAGDYPSGCATAEAGTGYYEAVTATGGVFLSICSEWATPANLSMLAAASIQQAAYELSATPQPSSIRVFVDGVERTDGSWFYDGPNNTVMFSAGIPNEGAHVRVTYGGLTDCD
jgi:hypothetical protein